MRLAVAALLLPFALASPLATPAATGQDAQMSLAPLSTTGELIEDSYIVVFKQGVNLDQIALHLSDVEKWHGLDVGVSLIYLGTIKLQPRTTIPILSRILSFPCDPRRQTSGNSFSRQSALLCSAPADHANSHSTRSPRMVKSTLAVLTTSTHPPPPTSATMATVSLQTLLCATIV